MLRKPLYLIFGLVLASLIFAGYYSSAQETNEVNDIIEEINELTNFAASTLGENPTSESIQKTKQMLEERKNPIKEKLRALKLYEAVRTNSERGNAVRDCFENNINKFVAVYQNILINKWYGDLNEVNNLREKEKNLGPNRSSAERSSLEKEIAAKRKVVETNIELLNALNETTEVYKSIFTE